MDWVDDAMPVEEMWDSYTLAFGVCEVEDWLMTNCPCNEFSERR